MSVFLGEGGLWTVDNFFRDKEGYQAMEDQGLATISVGIKYCS